MARRPAEALVGETLAGRWHVVQLLGEGGMAHVFLAEPSRSSQPDARQSQPEAGDRPSPVSAPSSARARVALKMLRAEHQRDETLVARFEREAVAAARVRHPNVLAVDAYEPARGELPPFFVMELLVGLDLADTLAFGRHVAPPRAVRIASALADALAAAHRAGVVHRDVKPENVFLVHAPDGREIVKLLDFGFAALGAEREGEAPSKRITMRHRVVGTPEYMAPEQAEGVQAAPTADVYSLGVVLFEMLAGRAPFRGGSFAEIAHKHLSEPLPSMRHLNPALAVSAELEAVVVRALAKAPSDRFPDMPALRAALDRTVEATKSPR